jgi:dTMP kinase
MKKGKLIVIDGIDGSGKSTQVDILFNRLKKEGFKVKKIDFPKYYDNFFGEFVGQCLSDKSYNWLNVHPKIASIVYACDRFESSGKMREWLEDGFMVIANRYVSSNQIHQGSKIKKPKDRADFMNWLDKMEHQTFKIPRPDVVFYLSLPINIVLNMLKERDKKEKRGYLKKKKDVHEENLDFLINSRKSAMKLLKEKKNFIRIDCSQKGKILSREEIGEKIFNKLKNKI